MTPALLFSALFFGSASAQQPQPTALPITQTILVSEFGAKGDGVSDDSTAFVAAIAAASKAGAKLILGDNTYLIKETLRIPHSARPMAIIGTGRSTFLLAPDHPLENGFLIENASSVELKSFIVRGAAKGLHCAININASSNIRLENLVIENINGEGISTLSAIRLSSDDQVWIKDSTISNVGLGSGKPAYVIWNYYKLRTQHLYITHNHIFDNTSNIVMGLFDTDYAVIADNIIDGGNNCVNPCINNGYGILFYRTETDPTFTTDTPESLWPTPIDETITNNTITNTAGSAIYLQGVHGAKVIRNTITNTGLQMSPSSLPVAGIALNASNDVRILDNTVNRSRQAGIALATTKDVLIKGNQIHDSDQCGIHLRVAQVRTTIRNNIVDGAPIGLFSERGPVGTILEKNTIIRVKQPRVGQVH